MTDLVVAHFNELTEDPQLVDRGFFTAVEHPEWGTRLLVGIPWRTGGGSPVPLRPPPRLGQVRG